MRRIIDMSNCILYYVDRFDDDFLNVDNHNIPQHLIDEYRKVFEMLKEERDG